MTLTKTVDESKRHQQREGPAVIISSSGMMTGGRILHHLRQRLPEARNTIVLGGFMAEGTRGRALQEGAKTLRVFGADVPVRAAVVEMSGLSGHAGHRELRRWLEPLATPRQVFITHGELSSATALAEELRRERQWNTLVPKMGQSVELSQQPAMDGRSRVGNIQPSHPAAGHIGVGLSETERNVQAILNSPSYVLAEQDTALLARRELRPVRLQLELLKPEMAFEEHNIASTIVVFGSTRIAERSELDERLRAARARAAADPADKRAAREVARAERLLAKRHYYDAAREFARLVSSRAKTARGGTWWSPAEARASWRPPIAGPTTSARFRSA